MNSGGNRWALALLTCMFVAAVAPTASAQYGQVPVAQPQPPLAIDASAELARLQAEYDAIDVGGPTAFFAISLTIFLASGLSALVTSFLSLCGIGGASNECRAIQATAAISWLTLVVSLPFWIAGAVWMGNNHGDRDDIEDQMRGLQMQTGFGTLELLSFGDRQSAGLAAALTF